jgi:hypothetical protein
VVSWYIVAALLAITHTLANISPRTWQPRFFGNGLFLLAGSDAVITGFLGIRAFLFLGPGNVR